MRWKARPPKPRTFADRLVYKFALMPITFLDGSGVWLELVLLEQWYTGDVWRNTDMFHNLEEYQERYPHKYEMWEGKIPFELF